MICFLIRKPTSIFIFKYWINIHYLPDMIPYQESNTETTYHDTIPHRESNIERTFIIWDNFLLTRGKENAVEETKLTLRDSDSGVITQPFALLLANNRDQSRVHFPLISSAIHMFHSTWYITDYLPAEQWTCFPVGTPQGSQSMGVLFMSPHLSTRTRLLSALDHFSLSFIVRSNHSWISSNSLIVLNRFI